MPVPKKTQNAFLQAIDTADLAAVNKLLAAGADPDLDPEFGSPLVRVGNMIWRSRFGTGDDTPITKKQRAIGKLLLERGAKLDFSAAVMLGDKQFVLAALAENPKLARSRVRPNNQKIDDAAQYCGFPEIALLLRDSDPKMADFNDATERLIRAIVTELRRFENKYPRATVTKLALATDWAGGKIVLAIDTNEGKKWKPAAFTHARFAELHAKPELTDLVKRGTNKTERDTLMLYAAAALSCVEDMGHLPFEIGEDFVALLFEPRSTEADARKLKRRADVKLTAHTNRSRFGSPVWDEK